MMIIIMYLWLINQQMGGWTHLNNANYNARPEFDDLIDEWVYRAPHSRKTEDNN